MVSRFDELLAQAAKSDHPPGLAAQVLYDLINSGEEEEAWDQMNAWVWERVPAMLARAITDKRPKPTRKSPQPSAGTRFGEALERHRSGNVSMEELTDFGLVMRVSDDGAEKTIGELTSSEHLYVADRFQGVGQSALMLAAIHRQVGRLLTKNPKLTTAEAMSQDQYRQLVAKVSGVNATEIE